ncbi:MAG: hypothetical protein JW818_20740 [Pirellulales bacterium]|nr:hypothetical protein [Pirellulales bacterium]
MTFSKTVLLLFLTMLCSVDTGCDRRDTEKAIQERTEKSVPKELLDAKFLESLRVNVSNDHQHQFGQLQFPADSPEAKLAREFLLSLLSDEEARQLPLRESAGLPPVRIRYGDDSPSHRLVFAVFAEPTVGYSVEVYARLRPRGSVAIVKRLVCNERIVEELNRVWDACERKAQQQKKGSDQPERKSGKPAGVPANESRRTRHPALMWNKKNGESDVSGDGRRGLSGW